jgi:hypothetical protein
MRKTLASAALLGGLLVAVGGRWERHPSSVAESVSEVDEPRGTVPSHATASTTEAISPEVLTQVVQRTCVTCHNDVALTGNLSLQGFDVAAAAASPEKSEKMIKKLRAGMMPPPSAPYRPAGDTLTSLAETLETLVDRAAAKRPAAGDRPFQRLNRAEYQASVRTLLGLEIDPGAYLPLDSKS